MNVARRRRKRPEATPFTSPLSSMLEKGARVVEELVFQRVACNPAVAMILRGIETNSQVRRIERGIITLAAKSSRE